MPQMAQIIESTSLFCILSTMVGEDVVTQDAMALPAMMALDLLSRKIGASASKHFSCMLNPENWCVKNLGISEHIDTVPNGSIMVDYIYHLIELIYFTPQTPISLYRGIWCID